MRRTVLILGLWGVGAAAGCKETGESTATPGDATAATSRPSASTGPAPPSLPGQAPKVEKPKQPDRPTPRPKDRDPEAERRKMSLSKDRSKEAERLLDQGKLADAILQAQQALRIHEQNVDAMLVIAEAFLKQGRFELASATTASALNVDTKVLTTEQIGRAYNIQGFAHIQAGKEQAATDAFRKAAEADAKNASAWNNLGTRYLDAGDVGTAINCFRYATELAPRFYKARLNLGAGLRADRKWQEAEKEFQRALQLRPGYPEVYFNLGLLYLDADPYPGLDTVTRLNKAIVNFTKYRELAVAAGPKGPAERRPGAGHNVPGSKEGVKPARVGVAVADDYIAVAKKGIEREERRKEREKKRKEKEAQKKAREAEKQKKEASQGGGQETPPKAEQPAPKQPAPKQPTQPKPQQPAPKKPAPKKPAPQKPKPQKPGGQSQAFAPERGTRVPTATLNDPSGGSRFAALRDLEVRNQPRGGSSKPSRGKRS